MRLYQKFLLKTANFLYPFRVIGAENIPDESAVICCNHLSAIDVTYLVKYFNRKTFFVGKKELFEKKFVGGLLASFGGVPIDRENVDVKNLMRIVKLLKTGHNMVIFPEGTRNKTGSTELLPFKGGSMVLALRTKRLILPVIIYKKAKIFRRNYMMIGKPFDLSQFYQEKTTDDNVLNMENFVRSKMIDLQNELFEKLDKKKGKKK